MPMGVDNVDVGFNTEVNHKLPTMQVDLYAITNYFFIKPKQVNAFTKTTSLIFHKNKIRGPYQVYA